VSDTADFFLDAETQLAREQYAVIYTPRKQQRKRFPANCVQPCESEAAAHAQSDAAKHLYAARVVGPSKSSEGLMMYYLVRWLA
jgi:hypothetical protein